jgi:hypothetical protein
MMKRIKIGADCYIGSLTEQRVVKNCRASASALRTTTPAETETKPDNFQDQFRHAMCNYQQCPLKATRVKNQHDAKTQKKITKSKQ